MAGYLLRVRQSWTLDASGNHVSFHQDRVAGRFENRSGAEDEADRLTTLACRHGR